MTAEQVIREALDGTLTKFTPDGTRTIKVPRDHIPTHRFDGRAAQVETDWSPYEQKPPRTPFTTDDKRLMIAMKRAGKTIHDIARAIRRSYATTNAHLFELRRNGELP